MRLRNAVMIGVAVLARACNLFDGPAGQGDLVALAAAKSRWDARPFADYSYEIRTFCFCPPELAQWTRVSVREGVVVEVVQVEPHPDFPITINAWQPMDSLFTRLFRAMSESGFGSHYAEVDVEYDRELGYPRSMAFQTKPNISDGGSSTEVRSVVPLN